jgi:putative phosphoribosyl transferase
MLMGLDHRLTIGPAGLPAELMVPAAATGLVVFAHGSDSGRRSPRNRQVAERLRQRGIGTLLVGLLQPDETGNDAKVLDIGLQAERLRDCVAFLHAEPALQMLPMGLFGASTGAAAALDCAAEPGAPVHAVVCRAGRTDLASALHRVMAPTLLIAGTADPQVLTLNIEARQAIGGESRVAVVPGASHLFSEPGALDRVADLAIDWFRSAFSAAQRQALAAVTRTSHTSFIR